MDAPRVPDSTLLAGLAAAIDRLAATGVAGEQGFHATFEALAWAGAGRDRFMKSATPIPTLTGLWYVRNLALHVGADVVWQVTAYGSGTYGSGAYGGVMFAFNDSGSSEARDMFPPRAALRDKDNARRNFGAAEYDSHVFGAPVLVVLRRALDEGTTAAAAAAAAATGAQTGAQGP
jgi:hypothetical protein